MFEKAQQAFKEREEYLFNKYDEEKVELYRQIRAAQQRAEAVGEVER